MIRTERKRTAVLRAPQVPWAVTNDKVRAAVERVVAASSPYAVILFGSYVRSEAKPGSDLDMLVVADDSLEHCRKESARLRRALRGISMPIDILVVRHGDFERLKDVPGLIYQEAVKKGKVAYERGKA